MRRRRRTRRPHPESMFGCADAPLWSGTPPTAIDTPWRYTPAPDRTAQSVMPGMERPPWRPFDQEARR